MEKLRVLLADDHAVLREGLAALINAQEDMYVIAHAQDGQSALAQAQTWQPDVVVMDLSMPGLNGLQATEELQKTCPQVHVVILTRHADAGYVRKVFQSGARGYVLKQAVVTELLAAIRTVVSGTTYLDSTVSVHIAQQFAENIVNNTANPDDQLSEREAAVIRLVAHGYSNKEIAGQLSLSIKTIDTYKSRAMDKLDIHSRAALVRYALAQGWFDREI